MVLENPIDIDRHGGGNVGQSPNGKIPPAMRSRLIELGEYLLGKPEAMPDSVVGAGYGDALDSLTRRGYTEQDLRKASGRLSPDYMQGGEIDTAFRIFYGELTENDLDQIRRAHDYLRETAEATVEDVEAQFYPVLTMCGGRINLLRRHIGIPERRHSREPLSAEGLETKRAEFLDYLKRNPTAGETDVDKRGYSHFRKTYPGGLEQAKKDAGIDTDANGISQIVGGLANRPDTGEVVDLGDLDLLDGGDDEGDFRPFEVLIKNRQPYDPKRPFLAIGRSRMFLEMMEELRTVASSNMDVVILGETGTGKKLVGKFIHDEGLRKKGPYITYNCSKTGLSTTIMLSELFGHRKGAYTGADSPGVGYFEAADKGDLVLEEVATLPLMAQTAFLDFFDFRSYRRLGEANARPVDIRIIAVTNQDLRPMVRAGDFRRDLYFRLAKHTIVVPPLRRRKDDIPLLVDLFLQKYAHYHNRDAPKPSTKYIDTLTEHSWPGNIRELENLIERSVVYGQMMLPENLGLGKDGKADGLGDGELLTMAEMEQRNIARALQETRGDRIAAARLLGIGKSTLYRRLKEYEKEGIELPGITLK